MLVAITFLNISDSMFLLTQIESNLQWQAFGNIIGQFELSHYRVTIMCGRLSELGETLDCNFTINLLHHINALHNFTICIINVAQSLPNILSNCINSLNIVVKWWKFVTSDRWFHDPPPKMTLCFCDPAHNNRRRGDIKIL